MEERKRGDEELRQKLRGIAERHKGGNANLNGGTSRLSGALKQWSSSSAAVPQRALSSGHGHDPSSSGTTSPRTKLLSPTGTECSAEGSRAANSERQLQDLRTRIEAFQQQQQTKGFKGKEAWQLEALAAAADAEPERTGTQGPGSRPSSAHQLGAHHAGPPLGPLEGELLWTVRQMDVHRKQIQIHQEQLSILERRHAELLVAVSSRTHSLNAGRGSPTGSSVSITRSIFPAESPEDSRHEESGRGYFAALSAADARLGIRGSRPGSAGSTVSAHSLAAASVAASGRGGGSVGGLEQRGLISSDGEFRRHSLGARASRELEEDQVVPRSPNSHSSHSPMHQHFHLDGGGALRSSPSGSGSDLGPPADGSLTEPEQVAALLRQLATRRPPRVPFVPLGDGAVDGEGVPYLHGSLEVQLRVSEDRCRLLVRVFGSGSGGRSLDIEEFLAKVDAIEARKSYRPNTIAEESELHDGGSHSPVFAPSAMPSVPPFWGSGLPPSLPASQASSRVGSAALPMSGAAALAAAQGSQVPSSLAGSMRSLLGGSASLAGGVLGAGAGGRAATAGAAGAAGSAAVGEALSPSGSSGSRAWKELFKSHWDSKG